MKHLRYYSEFKSTTGTLWRIEILQESDTPFIPAFITLSADAPVTIDWQKIDKSDQIMGSAATLKINSDSDRQYVDLYSIAVDTARLDIYRDGALYWSGTLDTELYEEPYSFEKNYDVEITFSDFAILERKECELNGFMTIKEVIEACLEATGISHTGLVQYVSTSRSGVAPEQLLQKDKVLCDNFYDEDGEAMSLQDVLEGVLKIYGLHITQKAGKVYLWDWHSLSGMQPERIVWDGDDATLGVDKVYNKVEINFSPYQITNIIEGKVDAAHYHESPLKYTIYSDTNKQLPSFEIGYSQFGGPLKIKDQRAKYYHIDPMTGGEESYGIAWTIDLYDFDTKSYVSLLNRPINTEALLSDHIRHRDEATQALFECPERPYIIGIGQTDGKCKLRLSIDALFDPRYNPFESASAENEEKAYNKQQLRANYVYIPFKLTLRGANGVAICHYENYQTRFGTDLPGKYYPNINAKGWVNGEAEWGKAFLCWYDEQDRQSRSGLNGWSGNKQCIGKADKRKASKWSFPKSFTHNNSGEMMEFPWHDGYLELEIGTGIFILDEDNDYETSNYTNCHWFLLKDPKLAIVDRYGEEIDSEDINIKAWINKSAKEGLNVDTIFGTPDKSVVMANGLIFDAATSAIMKEYSRAGKTGTLEQLLIGSIYSQYAKRHTTIAGTAIIPFGFGVYADKASSGLRFALLGETEDLMAGSADVSLCELTPDSYDAIEYDDGTWVRDWRVTSEWEDTGETCNATGEVGRFDCDGAYSVTYYRQSRTMKYCYPDMTGSTQTKIEYRVGEVASRAQVEGQCGYTTAQPKTSVTLSIIYDSGVKCVLSAPVDSAVEIYVDNSDTGDAGHSNVQIPAGSLSAYYTGAYQSGATLSIENFDFTSDEYSITLGQSSIVVAGSSSGSSGGGVSTGGGQTGGGQTQETWYTYRCRNCGYEFNSTSATAPSVCKECDEMFSFERVN